MQMKMDHHSSHHGHDAHHAHDPQPEPVSDSMEHMGGHHMDMMMMYFHGGYTEVILFDFWRINSLGGLIGSMIGCFLMGILYEGIKSYREYWMNGAFKTVSYDQVKHPSPSGRKSPQTEEGNASNESPRGDNISDQGSIKVIETKMWSLAHVVLSLLHLCQMTLAYFLMLIVMTYNSWLCASVIVGSTVGYFLFGWRKTTILDVSDHCH